MPKRNTTYLVLRRFDFAPRPNVVQAFKEGQEVRGLTRACVAHGTSLGALMKLKTEEPSNGETDHL